MKQTTIIIIAVVASVGATLAILEGTAYYNQYRYEQAYEQALVEMRAESEKAELLKRLTTPLEFRVPSSFDEAIKVMSDYRTELAMEANKKP